MLYHRLFFYAYAYARGRAISLSLRACVRGIMLCVCVGERGEGVHGLTLAYTMTSSVGTTKVATVWSATPSVTCPGIASSAAGGCSACANLGAGTSLSGNTATTCGSLSNPSPCCNLPIFVLAFTGTTSSRYAFLEFNVVLPPTPVARTCISSMRLAMNVYDGTIGAACTGTLFHTIETVVGTWSVPDLSLTIDGPCLSVCPCVCAVCAYVGGCAMYVPVDACALGASVE